MTYTKQTHKRLIDKPGMQFVNWHWEMKPPSTQESWGWLVSTVSFRKDRLLGKEINTRRFFVEYKVRVKEADGLTLRWRLTRPSKTSYLPTCPRQEALWVSSSLHDAGFFWTLWDPTFPAACIRIAAGLFFAYLFRLISAYLIRLKGDFLLRLAEEESIRTGCTALCKAFTPLLSFHSSCCFAKEEWQA